MNSENKRCLAAGRISTAYLLSTVSLLETLKYVKMKNEYIAYTDVYFTYRYIQEDILHPTDSLYYHFNKVFETFKV